MDTNRVLWELEQRRLITETMQDYCEFVDRNDADALALRVFSPDAAFQLGATRAVVGRPDLRLMFAKTLAAFSATSHHLSNVRIRFEGDDRATSTAYIYAWHRTLAGDGVEVWGRYADEHVLLDEGWRIAKRHLSMAGTEGWDRPPFEMIERLPNPVDPPAPTVTCT